LREELSIEGGVEKRKKVTDHIATFIMSIISSQIRLRGNFLSPWNALSLIAVLSYIELISF
jgi:hypothetical protein